jgi:hypothetical protein
MDNEIRVQRPILHTLIPLEDFKALLGVDDREDKISRFCLITATYTIEQYCKRRFFMKKQFERIEFAGDLLLPLREFPVREVLAVYAYYNAVEPELVEPEFYSLCPEIEEWLDIPHTLRLSPALGRLGDVLKLLCQAYPPKEPDIYRKGDNDFMHSFRF